MKTPRILMAGGLVLGLITACLPRSNPFDKANIEDAYDVYVTAALGTLTVHFSSLSGTGLKGYRLYREDAAGARLLVAELGADAHEFTDDHVAEAAAEAEAANADGTLWWRVSAFTSGGEGPLSTKADKASTRILPETRIEPALEPYISGAAGVAVLVKVFPSPLPGAAAARLYQYRFKGGQWTDPILAGPLVLTGLLDGRYTLEVAAVDDNGQADITPARAAFVYDFNVPEGTACMPAVCNPGLLCVTEPVGQFCRQQCVPPSPDGGVLPDAGFADCPLGLGCRLASGESGRGACVALADVGERCDERLCRDGLNCGDTGDGRKLCGEPCVAGACAAGLTCMTGDACMVVARINEGCVTAACAAGNACDDREANPRCHRICTSTTNCMAAELCLDLGRNDLRICR